MLIFQQVARKTNRLAQLSRFWEGFVTENQFPRLGAALVTTNLPFHALASRNYHIFNKRFMRRSCQVGLPLFSRVAYRLQEEPSNS